MKKLFFIILILVGFLNSYSQTNPDTYYGYHYVAGALMGGSVAVMHKSPKVAFTSSVVTGIGIGLAKEIYDVKYLNHQFSKKDFIFTVLGSITSGYIIRQTKKYVHFHKNLKKKIN